MTETRVPIPTLERLATYLRVLLDAREAGVQTVSSHDIERLSGISAAQFRKDLSYFGEFGKPGVGYSTQQLIECIERILRLDREQPMLLIGAGNLGAALVGYPNFHTHRFRIAAVFDNNFVKIGRPFGDLIIEDIARLKEVNARIGAQIAIIAVPANAAQEVADLLVEAGIRAILNFAPVSLKVPPHVHVRNVSFLQELAVLSYHLASDTEEASDSAQPLSCQQEVSNGVRAKHPAMRGRAIPAATTRTSPSKESSDAL
jgi:redox-sensing transcriptional repressor